MPSAPELLAGVYAHADPRRPFKLDDPLRVAVVDELRDALDELAGAGGVYLYELDVDELARRVLVKLRQELDAARRTAEWCYTCPAVDVDDD